MFDYLIISTDKLPVTDEEKKKIGKNPGWQTKDFDCQMTEIYITDEGELKMNHWEYETVPKEERPHPNDDGLLGMMGMLKRVNERLETIPMHGYVNFYTDVKGDWYEFNAKFTNGKLELIEGGKMID